MTESDIRPSHCLQDFAVCIVCLFLGGRHHVLRALDPSYNGNRNDTNTLCHYYSRKRLSATHGLVLRIRRRQYKGRKICPIPRDGIRYPTRHVNGSGHPV